MCFQMGRKRAVGRYRVLSWVFCICLFLSGCTGADQALDLLGFPTDEQDTSPPGPSVQAINVPPPRPVTPMRQPKQPVVPPPSAIIEAPLEDPLAGLAPVRVNEVAVGLLLPLSGRDAAIGRAMLDAASLALHDLADNRFRLIVRDTGGLPTGAVQAAISAMDAGADILLGPLFSASTKAVADIAARRDVTVISFSNDRHAAGRNVFLMGLLPSNQINRVITHALSQNLTRFAILAPDTADGQRSVAQASDIIARGGGQVVRTMMFLPDGSDLDDVVRLFADYDQRRLALQSERAALQAADSAAARRALTRLSILDTLGDPPFDAVFLPVSAQQVREVATRLAFFDVDSKTVRFLGLGSWANEPALLSEPSLSGAWFASPPAESWAAFKQHFESNFGTTPPRIAGIAYDATALTAVLGLNAQGIALNELLSTSGFAGVDGVFRLTGSGLSERALALMELHRRGLIVRDPPAQSFAQFDVLN